MSEPIIEQAKACKKCGEIKPLGKFTKQKLGRLGRTAECNDCLRARNAAFRATNPEKVREYSRRDVQKNKEKRRERENDWRAKNPDKRQLQALRYYYRHRETILKRNKPYQVDYWAKHPEVRAEAKQKRRAAERSAPGICTPQQWMAKCEFWGWRCYLCNVRLDETNFSQDHRIPLSRGGSNWPANLAPACQRCNESKSQKTDREYKVFQQEIIMAFSR